VRYFDTSALAPLILPEASSALVERYINRLPGGELATSHWARVEIASLLARKIRAREFDRDQARGAAADFESLFARSFELLDTRSEDFELARRYLLEWSTGLRAGDALHLAIAVNRNIKSICTLDKTMLKAGRALSLPMESEIR